MTHGLTWFSRQHPGETKKEKKNPGGTYLFSLGRKQRPRGKVGLFTRKRTRHSTLKVRKRGTLRKVEMTKLGFSLSNLMTTPTFIFTIGTTLVVAISILIVFTNYLRSSSKKKAKLEQNKDYHHRPREGEEKIAAATADTLPDSGHQQPQQHQPTTKNNRSKSKTQQRLSKVAYTHPWILTTLKAHGGPVLDLDFSSNKKYLASCAEESRDTSVRKDCFKKGRVRKKKSKTRESGGVGQTVANSLCNAATEMLCLPRNLYYVPAIERPLMLGEVGVHHGHNRCSQPLGTLPPSATLYQLLRVYVSNDEQRIKHGYPIKVVGRPGIAYIPDPRTAPCKKEDPGNDKEPRPRPCCRCGKEFMVNANGDYATRDKCVYHWGKLLRTGNAETYSCCSDARDSEGCAVGVLHVSEGKCFGFLDGFVETRPTLFVPLDGNFGVCSLDCEMCFTTVGLEVARVTLLRPDGSLLYDAFVKPQNPIIDYNTRFSGLTAKDLDGVNRTLQDVQRDFLNLLNADTILVGHGLENDLRALRLIHPNVVDTAVLFPHHYGLPFRRSLRSLVGTYLHKDIQTRESGHDSHEDAKSCMDLVLWKLQMDMKRFR